MLINGTCIDRNHLQPLYDQVLGCIVLVVVLSVLILCKLLKKQLEKLYKGLRSLSSSRNGSFNLSTMRENAQIGVPLRNV